jgi:hypothetical protein
MYITTTKNKNKNPQISVRIYELVSYVSFLMQENSSFLNTLLRLFFILLLDVVIFLLCNFILAYHDLGT